MPELSRCQSSLIAPMISINHRAVLWGEWIEFPSPNQIPSGVPPGFAHTCHPLNFKQIAIPNRLDRNQCLSRHLGDQSQGLRQEIQTVASLRRHRRSIESVDVNSTEPGKILEKQETWMLTGKPSCQTSMPRTPHSPLSQIWCSDSRAQASSFKRPSALKLAAKATAALLFNVQLQQPK